MLLNSGPINSGILNAQGGGGVVEDVAETAVVTNPAPELADYLRVTDTAVVVAAVDPTHRASFLRDSAVLDGSVEGLRTANLVLRSTAVASAKAVYGAVAVLDVAETAVVTDQVTLSDPDNVVRDSAVVVSAADQVVTARLVVRESARIRDGTSAATVETVTETGVIGDAAYPRNLVLHTIRETAALSDSVTLQGSLTTDIRDNAVVTSSASGLLLARTVVREDGFLSDSLSSAQGSEQVDSVGAVGDVWTANLYNWAMSRYSAVGFSARGERFAVSENGLYEVSNDSYSAAVIETGFLTLDTPALKRVSHLYLVGETAGAIAATVTADVDGVRASYEYTPLARDTSATRAIRFSLGRRLRSTHYKVKFSTTGRTDLQGFEALANMTQRRV